jgi:hypothetical protein
VREHSRARVATVPLREAVEILMSVPLREAVEILMSVRTGERDIMIV